MLQASKSFRPTWLRSASFSGNRAKVAADIASARRISWIRVKEACKQLWEPYGYAASGLESHPLQHIYTKNPYICEIIRKPGLLPESLSHLCVSDCPASPPLKLHAAAMRENLTVFVTTLHWMIRLAGPITHEEYKRSLNALVNATTMIYLSQRFHCFAESKLCKSRMMHQVSGDLSVKVDSTNSEQKANNAAILLGDFFITQVYACLSELNNNAVAETMSDALAKFSQINFDYSAATARSEWYNEPLPPEGAVRSLLGATMLTAGRLLKTDEHLLCDLIPLAQQVGSLYYQYLNALVLFRAFCFQEDEGGCVDVKELQDLRAEIRECTRVLDHTYSSTIAQFRRLKTTVAMRAAGESLLEHLGCRWIPSSFK